MDSDFPGSSVVKTLGFHSRGQGFSPWLGEPRSYMHFGAQPKKKDRNEWIKKMWHIHTTNKNYSALKGKGILSDATTLVHLEDRMLSEISQPHTKGQILSNSTYPKHLEQSSS